MGVTTYTVNLVNGQIDNASYWIASAYSADWGATEEVKATPGAGYALCITQIDLMAQDDRIFVIGEKEIVAGAVTTVKFSFPMNAMGGGQVKLKFLRPIELAENANLTADSGSPVGAQDASIVVHGFTRKIT